MVRFPEGAGDYFFLHNVYIGSEAHLASYSVAVEGEVVKADHSLSFSAEVKNERNYTSSTPYAFVTYADKSRVFLSDKQLKIHAEGKCINACLYVKCPL